MFISLLIDILLYFHDSKNFINSNVTFEFITNTNALFAAFNVNCGNFLYSCYEI